MTLYKWSKTAATNATADSTINWAEGMAPSSVNDSSRGEMAAVAKYRDDMAGSIDTGGSSTAFTASSNQVTTELVDGFSIVLRLHTASGADPTLNLDATGAKAIRIANGTAPLTGALPAKSTHKFTYDAGDDCWYVSGYFSVTTLLGSALNIIDVTEETSPAVGDIALLYDLSATANRRFTLPNMLKVLTALDAETAPAIGDELLLYDLSETAVNKITLPNMLKVINGLTEDTTPDKNADFLLTYDDSASLPKKVKPTNLIAPGAIVAIFEDNKSSGSDAQEITAGADRTRHLNTTIFNRGSIASLDSNQFTLPAGTWEISWWVLAAQGGSFHQSLLYNATDAATVKRGSTGLNDGGSTPDAGLPASLGCTVVTIADSKAFEIRHRTDATIRGGRPASLGTEVYAQVIVRIA